MNQAELQLMQLVSSTEAWMQRPVDSLRVSQAMLQALDNAPGAATVDIVAKDGSREDAVAAFEKWLRDNGVDGAGEAWGVVYMGAEKGNGIVVKSDAQAGACIMRIPRSMMFSAATRDVPPAVGLAAEDNAKKRYYACLGRLVDKVRDNETLALALTLLFHALRPDSFYASYIGTLPNELSTPLYWGIETFEYLIKVSPDVATRAMNSLRAAVGLYIRTLHTLREFEADDAARGALPLPSWRSFRWAMACTTSRQNMIPSQDGAVLALVPGWDCLNHDSSVPPSTSFEDEYLEYRAPTDYKAGEELHMNYGAQRSNIDLLLYAGFAVSGNPIAELQLRLPALPQDAGKMRRVIFDNLCKISGALVSPGPSSPASDSMRAIVYPSRVDLLRDLTANGEGGRSIEVSREVEVDASSTANSSFVRAFIYPTTALCVAVASQISKEDIGGLLRQLLALPAGDGSKEVIALPPVSAAAAAGGNASMNSIPGLVVVPKALARVVASALSSECRDSVRAALGACFSPSDAPSGDDDASRQNVLPSVITVVAERADMESSFARINDMLLG